MIKKAFLSRYHSHPFMCPASARIGTTRKFFDEKEKMDIQFNNRNNEIYIQTIFNGIANRYDLMNTLMSFGLDKSWRRFAVKRTGLEAGGSALDVCCGTGMLTMELAWSAGPTGSIVGLDFSANMLAIAQRNLEHFPYRNTIRFIQGNAMELPFEDNSFDCVTVSWGLKNVPDIATVVQEMIRVVKPCGKVVSLDMGQPDAPFFKELYWLYFKKVIPLMGKIWGGNKPAYEYLYDSSRLFISPQEMTRLFSKTGLTETTFLNLCKGAVAVVEGGKATHLFGASMDAPKR